MRTSTTRRLPAEWERHEATIVAWPGRPSVWGDHLRQGQTETLNLVRRIAQAERVILAIPPAAQSNVLDELGDAEADIVRIPLDDCWARDIAPLFVLDTDAKTPRAVDFAFNAWGGKFQPYANDAAFGCAISEHLGLSRQPSNLVLEGGSITTDGCGTAILVETSVLNPNRNPDLDRAAVEAILNVQLGIETVIWLPYGLLGDTDTDGHVDNVAVFCATGRVLVQVAPSARHADGDRLMANHGVLRRARDASGQQLELVEIPWLPVSKFDSSRPCSYVNVFPTNHSVLVPAVGDPADARAADLVSVAFDGRPATPVASNALSFGGGGPHCMTMQVPASSYTTHEGEGHDH